MPRYKYQCKICNDHIMVFHGIDESYTYCSACEASGSMQKLLSTPLVVKQQQINNNQKVGDLTHEYIEANREILNQQKKEAREKKHVKT